MIVSMIGVMETAAIGRGNARVRGRKEKGARIAKTRAPGAAGATVGTPRRGAGLNGGWRHVGEIAKEVVDKALALGRRAPSGPGQKPRVHHGDGGG